MRGTRFGLLMTLCLVGSSEMAGAQQSPATAQGTARAEQSPVTTHDTAGGKQGTGDGKQGAGDGDNSARSFSGLKFGVGLSFTADTGKHDRVEDATVDANGVVRVTKTNNGRARVMLEAHYFFPPLRQKSTEEANWGWGPFVAVQPGSDEIINALGIGILFGWRHDKTSNQSFNLGVGISVDPSTKVLGDEFVEDQPAPKGPDAKPLPVRFKTRDQEGFLLLASFGWR
jgi:hypothetical protein